MMYDIDVYVNIHLAKEVMCAYKLDCICKATRGYIFIYFIAKKKNLVMQYIYVHLNGNCKE